MQRPGQKRQADWDRDKDATAPTELLPERKAASSGAPSPGFPAHTMKEAVVDRPNPFASLSTAAPNNGTEAKTTFSFSFGAKPAVEASSTSPATKEGGEPAAPPKFNFSFGKSDSGSASASGSWADKPATPTATAGTEPAKFSFSFGGGFGSTTTNAATTNTATTNFFQSAVKASADLADEKNKARENKTEDDGVVADADVNVASLDKVDSKLAAAPILAVTEEEGVTVLNRFANCKALRYDVARKEWVEKGMGPLVVASKEASGHLKYRATIHSEATKHLMLYLPVDKTFGIKGTTGSNVTVFVAEMDEATGHMKPTVYCLKCSCESDAKKVSEILATLVETVKAA